MFLVRQGELITPRAENLLPGITRHLVLEVAAECGISSGEADITPAEGAAGRRYS